MTDFTHKHLFLRIEKYRILILLYINQTKEGNQHLALDLNKEYQYIGRAYA